MSGLSYTKLRLELEAFCKEVNKENGSKFSIQSDPIRHYIDIIHGKTIYIRIMDANKCSYRELDGFRDMILMKVGKQLVI